MWRKKSLKIEPGLAFYTLSIVCLMFFVTVFWAVDRGMAVMGGLKFLPAFLFGIMLMQDRESREDMIKALPGAGAVITSVSVLLAFIPAAKPFVLVSGRLGGSFEYPNTFALFLLVCAAVDLFIIKTDGLKWYDLLCAAVCSAGIFLTGSRITAVIFAGFVLCMIPFLSGGRIKLRWIIVVAAVIIAAAVFLYFAGMQEVYRHILQRGLSTMWGRLLYVRDAFSLVIRHPFGMGYYGYYFTRGQYQTGVYYVVNVHNEFMQTALDIGVIPAVLFAAAVVREIFFSDGELRDRVIILLISLHALLDYDFQFMGMIMVFMLFWKMSDSVELRIPSLAEISALVLSLLIVWRAGVIGASDHLFRNNNYNAAYACYTGNTLAGLKVLSANEDKGREKVLAESVIARNSHAATAYAAKARCAMKNLDIKEMMEYQDRAITLDPYNYRFYVNYLTMLSGCAYECQRMDDHARAVECAKKMQAVEKRLRGLKDRTSYLGWKLEVLPQTMLVDEYRELVDNTVKDFLGGNET